MARTVDEVITGIDADIAADPVLSVALTSSSRTALWRLFRGILASAIVTLEKRWDVFFANVNATIATHGPHNTKWYAQIVYDFQLGDSLTWVNNVPGYAVIDPTKQIIAKTAVIETNLGLIIKVAKLSGSALVPLDAVTELPEFIAYIKKRQDAGPVITCLSLTPGYIEIPGNYYYDSINALADVQADVDAKLQAYLQSVDYNGTYYLSEIENVLRGCLGFNDYGSILLKAKENGASVYIDEGRKYLPLAGYLTFNVLPSTSLTFIAV